MEGISIFFGKHFCAKVDKFYINTIYNDQYMVSPKSRGKNGLDSISFTLAPAPTKYNMTFSLKEL